MLYQIFTTILAMSMTASVVITAVLFIRCLMYRMPARYRYLLWLIVGIRLICPIAAASPASLFNMINPGLETSLRSYIEPAKTQPSSSRTSQNNLPDNDLLKYKIDTAGHTDTKSKQDIAVNQQLPGSSLQTIPPLLKYGAVIWLTGMVILLLWNFHAAARMRHRLKNAIKYQDNIYECGNIPSPFVIGTVRPKIYIPFRLDNEDREYILKHEQYHIKRKDHLIKIAAVMLTCIYWFHPLVWLSYYLMNQDMEMSCDEYVLQHMAADIRTRYSRSLLGFAANQRNVTAGMLPFGESNTRKRVKNVLHFKKHGKWVGITAAVLIIIAGTACLTDAMHTENPSTAGTEDTRLPNNSGEVIVADAVIHGYQVRIVYLSENADNTLPSKQDLEFGLYKGNFEIQTYKNDKRYADFRLQIADEMYFPADGFPLAIQDYDADGDADDFALGQGQTPDPLLGNYMSYCFFTINEDGTIAQHALSTQDGQSITTIPGGYSIDFPCKDGMITYRALGENGTEEQTASIIQWIPFDQSACAFSFPNTNVTLCLPSNTAWIQNPKAYTEGQSCTITYYDNIAHTDVTLYFHAEGQPDAFDFSDRHLAIPDAYEWSYMADGKSRLIQIHIYTMEDNTTMARLTWSYQGMQFEMHADLPDFGTDSTSWEISAKVAAYIAGHWHYTA